MSYRQGFNQLIEYGSVGIEFVVGGFVIDEGGRCGDGYKNHDK